MAVHTSVIKRARQNVKARQRNRIWKSRIKSTQKRIEQALINSETDSIQELYRQYCSLVDRASSKKVIHKNTAARKKTRLAQKIHSLPSSQ